MGAPLAEAWNGMVVSESALKEARLYCQRLGGAKLEAPWCAPRVPGVGKACCISCPGLKRDAPWAIPRLLGLEKACCIWCPGVMLDILLAARTGEDDAISMPAMAANDKALIIGITLLVPLPHDTVTEIIAACFIKSVSYHDYYVNQTSIPSSRTPARSHFWTSRYHDNSCVYSNTIFMS
jgi:hypothetical protein